MPEFVYVVYVKDNSAPTIVHKPCFEIQDHVLCTGYPKRGEEGVLSSIEHLEAEDVAIERNRPGHVAHSEGDGGDAFQVHEHYCSAKRDAQEELAI